MNKTKKHFFKNLSIDNLSFVLTAVVAVGILLIGAIAHFGVTSMKEDYNSFYNKRFAAIQTLSKTREIYTTDIQRTLFNVQKKDQDIEALISYIDESKETGLSNWKNFLSLYYKSVNKDDVEQQRIVDSLQEHILRVNKLLEDALLVLQEEGKDAFFQLGYTPVQKSINLLDIKISNLSAYHFRLATQEKDAISQKYDNTQTIVFIVTVLVTMLSIFLTYLVARSFQRSFLHFERIARRRKEDNIKMELRIKEEFEKTLEKARENDHIMYQNARHASMGEMIGNIAHQWRQPLNALTLLIQSFGTKSLSGKLSQSFIDKQVNEGLRLAVSMSDTIEDFRNFFSPSKEKEYFDVEKSIHETLEMSSFFVQDENIDISVKCGSDIKIYGYANEFSHVIMNFINNARDNFKQKEMHEDKKIEIEIVKIKGDEPAVCVYFRDNGGGIEEHIIDRVFEPYFTTKHKASGTGIGLYMSKQIIEAQMSGLVSVKNVDKVYDEQAYMCAEFKIAVPV